MDKNLALQKQESELLKISDEQKFAIALGELSIAELPEKNLREALRYAMVKIGLRGLNYPKGIEKSLLLQHVYENFGELTPAEIRLAFDWAINGRLPVDVNCFENFSCKYVSDILNAYRNLKRLVKEKPVQHLIEQKPDLDQIEKEYQEFLQTELGKQLNPKI